MIFDKLVNLSAQPNPLGNEQSFYLASKELSRLKKLLLVGSSVTLATASGWKLYFFAVQDVVDKKNSGLFNPSAC